MHKKHGTWRMAVLFLGIAVLSVSGCGDSRENAPDVVSGKPDGTNEGTGTQETSLPAGEGQAGEEPEKEELPEEKAMIDSSGKTLTARIGVPDGYTRVKAKEGSLADFLRKYRLKKDGSPVLLYDGSKKGNQGVHVAVLKLPIENEDLQQCADSVMRVYAEYYWQTGQYDRIAFHFVDGFLAEYGKWRQGYRIQVGDGGTSWVKSASADSSYDTFKKYLRMVFAYAGTPSLESESEKIKLSDIRTGDIFIRGGSPGHVVMVADVCKNKEGRKAFLLAQGYMPAQEFHVLKNPLHEEDPWYYEEEVDYPLETPEYNFNKGSLRRPGY